MSAVAARPVAPGKTWGSQLALQVVQALAMVAVLAAVWEGAVRVFDISPYYLPRLSAVVQSMLDAPQAYIDGFLRTLSETVLGFVAGAVVGVVFGVVFRQSRLLRETVFPIFVISQTIPVIAFGAVVVLWFGNTILAKAMIAFYLTFFPVTVNTLQGLESVDRRQEDLLRSFGASRWQLLFNLQLPAALPKIFVALRLACTLSLLGAIAGEWFGDTVGLGVLLLQAMYNEQMIALWGAILASGLLGTGFFAIVALAEQRIVFWRSEL